MPACVGRDDRSPEAVSDEDEPAKPKTIGDHGHVSCEAFDRVIRIRWTLGLSHAAQIEGDGPPARTQMRELHRPLFSISAVAVDEENGRGSGSAVVDDEVSGRHSDRSVPVAPRSGADRSRAGDRRGDQAKRTRAETVRSFRHKGKHAGSIRVGSREGRIDRNFVHRDAMVPISVTVLLKAQRKA